MSKNGQDRKLPLRDLKALRAAIREAEREAGTLGRRRAAWWGRNARAEARRRACRGGVSRDDD